MFVKIFFIRYVSGYQDYIQTFRSYGIPGLLQELRNRSKIWSIKELRGAVEGVRSNSSSITDEPNYLTVCSLAQRNREILSKFKSCYEYRLVLEHVSRFQGEKYFSQIRNNRRITENMLEIAASEIGNPLKYEYPVVGQISPTQLRYAKILQDLERMFDFTRVRRIAEIGIGNGGQAAQICNLNQVEDYTLIDLEPVLGLTRMLLPIHKLTTNFEFLNPELIDSLSTDLTISNYAFSELNKAYQDIYIKNVLNNSTRGFMLYNQIHEDPETGYTALEMVEKIPGARLFAEEPLTYIGNVVVAWGFDEEKVANYFTPIPRV
jgi:putative sugar O-methyltransferase